MRKLYNKLILMKYILLIRTCKWMYLQQGMYSISNVFNK